MGTTKNFFETYLKKETLFLDKSVLQSSYTPDTIPHREEQTKQVAEILAPALKMELPSNLFIYGKTGTGKTLVIKHITSQLIEITRPQQVVLQALYTNCKLKRVADTEYRFIAELCRTMGKTVPPTGLPTDEVYKIFLRTIDDTKQIIILILDEIDHLINKAGDEVLYNLLRLNAELSKCRISIIGISNDVQFIDYIDPRIRSSLSEEEIVFPPYNALQIKEILKKTRKGLDKIEILADERVFPVEVRCLRCNHSLMDESFLIDGYPSIRVTVYFGGKHGWLRLSSLYGSPSVKQEYERPPNTLADFFCPHCHSELKSTSKCPKCSAPMVVLTISGGGIVQVCSRRGCKGHLLDINNNLSGY